LADIFFTADNLVPWSVKSIRSTLVNANWLFAFTIVVFTSTLFGFGLFAIIATFFLVLFEDDGRASVCIADAFVFPTWAFTFSGRDESFLLEFVSTITWSWFFTWFVVAEVAFSAFFFFVDVVPDGVDVVKFASTIFTFVVSVDVTLGFALSPVVDAGDGSVFVTFTWVAEIFFIVDIEFEEVLKKVVFFTFEFTFVWFTFTFVSITSAFESFVEDVFTFIKITSNLSLKFTNSVWTR
jgi:hypothetical protein